LRLGAQDVAHALQQGFKQGQRQTHPRLAIGSRRKGLVGQAPQSATGDVAMQDLQQKELQRGHGIQGPLAPVILQAAAHPEDGFRRKDVRDTRLELPNDVGDSKSHPWPPVDEAWLAPSF
jgi:hypothetical protein